MTTEQKIREAYENAVKNDPYMNSLIVFKAGYSAALADLISVGKSPVFLHQLLRLP